MFHSHDDSLCCLDNYHSYCCNVRHKVQLDILFHKIPLPIQHNSRYHKHLYFCCSFYTLHCILLYNLVQSSFHHILLYIINLGILWYNHSNTFHLYGGTALTRSNYHKVHYSYLRTFHHHKLYYSWVLGNQTHNLDHRFP